MRFATEVCSIDCAVLYFMCVCVLGMIFFWGARDDGGGEDALKNTRDQHSNEDYNIFQSIFASFT